MARKVLLPQELERRLNKLTSLVQEVKGVLFYRPQEEYCPLETIFMTGVGTEGHVQANPGRLEIVNEFFKRNQDYHYVEFHTHCKGTIGEFGRYYAQNFSQQDIASLTQKLRDDAKYMHLLVTPETKLLWGAGSPVLQVVDTFPGYKQRNQALDTAVNMIASRLGYDVSKLPASK